MTRSSDKPLAGLAVAGMAGMSDAPLLGGRRDWHSPRNDGDETMKFANYIRNSTAWRSPARRASSTRDRIPSLAKTWRRCEFTVCAEM